LLIKNVNCNPTRIGFIKILKKMNANIRIKNLKKKSGEHVGNIFVKSGSLKPINCPKELVSSAIDEFPLLFIIASVIKGVCKFSGIYELRHKESDKIKKIEIHTSHHTHNVIGTGANDPQKMDPNASRETLDHSIMYIFAVALEDGNWHHINSYTPQRANKKSTVDLWKKIKTFEDKKWTKKYHDSNPKKKCFGGRVIIKMKDGSKIEDQLGIADAHPNGKRPFKREDYINKFKTLTANIIDQKESERFLEDVQNLKEINKSELHKLNVEVVSDLQKQRSSKNTIF